MNLRSVIALGLACSICGGAASTNAVVYSAANDFSATNNPDGVWSYGAEQGLGAPFQIYQVSQKGAGIDIWNYGGATWVAHNGTSGGILAGGAIWQPNVLGLHPSVVSGYGNEDGPYDTIVRWTAPASGVYDVNVTFSTLSTNYEDTEVHVLVNNTSVFDGFCDGAIPFGVTTTNLLEGLGAGDNIDFAVGVGTDGVWQTDETGLSATVTPIIISNGTSLALSGTVTPNPIIPGSNLIYAIVVRNTGGSEAIGVTITNVLPLEVLYSGADLTGDSDVEGSYMTHQLDGTVLGHLPGISAGGSASLTVTGQLRCTAFTQKILFDAASVSSFTPDTILGSPLIVRTTNGGRIQKAACSNTIAFTESYADKIFCSGSGYDFGCSAVPSDKLTIKATLSLLGVDVTQFNANTPFDITVGNFSADYSLSDDPHWSPGKTSATFVDREAGDIGNLVSLQTIRLKWTASQLTVTVTGNNPETPDVGFTPVLAPVYDQQPTGVINDAVPATLDFGGVTNTFDAVYCAGALVTTDVFVNRAGDFTVSRIRIIGAAGN